MPESTTTEAQQAQPAEAVRASETPEQTIAALREALAKANSEAKDNRLKASELDKLKLAQMSDLERLAAERDQARKDAQDATSQALRWRIAAAHGINDADAETFLTGADEATLAKQAARLVELRATSTAPAVAPRPDLTQGGSGSVLPLNGDGLESALRAKLGIN